MNGNTFTATGVPLREGGNVITAVAMTDRTMRVRTAYRGTRYHRPKVIIDSPADGSVVTEDTITVTGRVNDVVLGTINSGQAQVSVNGHTAVVANRSFAIHGIALLPGPNTIAVTSRDSVGNVDTTTRTIVREYPGLCASLPSPATPKRRR